MAAKKASPKAKTPSKKALYESFVGKKYVYENTTYAVGRVLPEKDFATVSVNNGYGEHYYRVACADFVEGAILVEATPDKKCDGAICQSMSGYLTGFDGSDLCPSCLLVTATETCEACSELDDHESAAFVGNYVFCRDCYNGMDDDEIERLREE